MKKQKKQKKAKVHWAKDIKWSKDKPPIIKKYSKKKKNDIPLALAAPLMLGAASFVFYKKEEKKRDEILKQMQENLFHGNQLPSEDIDYTEIAGFNIKDNEIILTLLHPKDFYYNAIYHIERRGNKPDGEPYIALKEIIKATINNL